MGMSAITSDMAKQRRALLSSFLEAEAAASMRLAEVDAVRSAVEAACNTCLPSPSHNLATEAIVSSFLTNSFCIFHCFLHCELILDHSVLVVRSMLPYSRLPRQPAVRRAPDRWRNLRTCCSRLSNWASRFGSCNAHQTYLHQERACPRRLSMRLRSLTLSIAIHHPVCCARL